MIKDGLKSYKHEAISEMDSLILDSIDKSDFYNFKEYKNEMETFTFDSVFN